MTSRPRRRSLRATVAAIAALSGVCFIGIFGGLVHQMAASRDPALGPKAQALAAARDQPSSRRIVRRTIVVRKVHDPGATAPAAPAVVQVPPAAAQPPPPAPAPAPAPVVTKVS